jgi:hypothetical protein
VLAVADALVVAPMADAVLYVANEQSTPRGAVIAARQQLIRWRQPARRRPQRRRGQGAGYAYTGSTLEQPPRRTGPPRHGSACARRVLVVAEPAPPRRRRRRSSCPCVVVAILVAVRWSSSSACVAISCRDARPSPRDGAKPWPAIHGRARPLRTRGVSFQQAVDRSHGPIGWSRAASPGWEHRGRRHRDVERGRLLSAAGTTLTDALEALPDGIGSLAPTGGVLPLERYQDLAAAVDSARDDATQAADALGTAPDRFVPEVVARAGWDGRNRQRRSPRTSTGSPSSCTLDASRAQAPRVATSCSPRIPQSCEARGYLGRVRDRDPPRRSGIRPAGAADPDPSRLPAGRVPSPSEEYARTYDPFGGAGAGRT